MNSYVDAVKEAALFAAKRNEPVGVYREVDGFSISAGIHGLRAHLRVNPDGSTVEVPERTWQEVCGTNVSSERNATFGPGKWTGD